MKKNAVILIIVTALSLIINWAAFLMIRRTKEIQNQKIMQSHADSLYAKVDSLKGKQRLNPLHDLKNKILAVHEKNILKKMLIKPEIADKVNQNLLQQIDLAMKSITNTDANFDSLRQTIEDQKKAMLEKDKRINELMTELQNLKNQPPKVDEQAEAEKAQEQTLNLDYLAKTYESMKPNEAVPSLMLLDESDVVSVLKLMSTRKRGKLMAAFPAAKAAQLAKKIAKGN